MFGGKSDKIETVLTLRKVWATPTATPLDCCLSENLLGPVADADTAVS